jgi:hypothetical protein
MKRLLTIALAMLCISTAGLAQAKTSKSALQTKPAVKKEVVKTQMNKSTKDQASNKTTTTTTTATTTTKTKLKKDGTPDKRFKENKTMTTTATTTGPKKKDGTPDMRYKANKKKG